MGYVNYEVNGMVGIVTIDRPKALNALNKEVLTDLKSAFKAIDTDEIRCVILTGSGEKSFVAGADIAAMSTMTSAEGEAFSKFGNDIFRMIETFPVPVIAAVNGFALGGGCELSLACDFRYCSENAVFGLPEVTLGIMPGFGGTQRLERVVGSGIAKELLFTAKRIKADEALAIGLVNSVYPQAELMEAAIKTANAIAKNAPIGVRRAKTAMNNGYDVDMDKAIIYEEQAFGGCFGTEDQKEGMAAFLEKRKVEKFLNK